MGQQQLLLLVLGAVIVGLAIVIGINMFGQGEIHAQEDAIKNDLLTMASRVEEFWRKPATLGGGGKAIVNFDIFPEIGYNYNESGTAITGAIFINSNAEYSIGAGTGIITAQPVAWVDDLTNPEVPVRTYTKDTAAKTFYLTFTESGNGIYRHLSFAITP